MPGHILIVDDIPTNRILLRAKLTEAYYQVVDAADGETARDILRRSPPDLVLLDVMLPGMDGYELCRWMKSEPSLAHIPIIMITALSQANERLKGFDAGADDFLTKPYDDEALLARVRNLMRSKLVVDELRMRYETSRDMGLCAEAMIGQPKDPETCRALLVPGSVKIASAWQAALPKGIDFDCDIALSAEEAEELAAAQPDIILVSDTIADGSSGVRLLSALRSRAHLRATVLIFQAHPGHASSEASVALDQGAGDFIPATVDDAEFGARIRGQLRRKAYADRLRAGVVDGLRLAATDPLTGLYNRRYALYYLERITKSPPEEIGPIALLMLDLDEFKRVNDHYGHAVGDDVLREFAARLRDNVRSIDLVARLGGEEFCVAMPGATASKAMEVAERLREAIATRPFVSGTKERPVMLTASVGVACMADTDAGVDILFERADQALYAAKEGGRNKVILSAAA